MIKFRPHRGGFAESMAEVREFATDQELMNHIKTSMLFSPCDNFVMLIKPYIYDDRNGWDTHIVMVKDYGVAGFTDGDFS
jgi:hypothetical protein